jgi:uncharacterized membrane protein YccC
VLLKGFWRITGSVAGAAAAVVLVANFAQAPVLFVLGLAAWLGLCTFVSSLLRYFRSYGVVLAGYTVVLVAIGALDHPDEIFLLACSRVAVVTTGVVASGVVSMATDWGPGRAQLAATLGGLIAQAARLLVDAAGTAGGTALPAARSRIAAALTSLDQAIEFAAVEDAGFRLFARDMRLAAAELFAALTGGPRAAMLLAGAAAEQPAVAPAAQRVMALLGRIAGLEARPGAVSALLREIAAVRAALGGLRDGAPPATYSALEQTATLLGQFEVAAEVLAALQRGVPRGTTIRLHTYVNPSTARRNGLRAALAVTIAGLFWIVSQWPSGGTMLAALGPISALVAQADSAAAASVGFLRGMVLAALAAFVCTFGLLPQMDGFPLLLLAMLPFVAAGLFATGWPLAAPMATPFLIFFVTMTGATNPMRFDMAAFLNSAAALILGALCGVLTFRILLPPNPVAEAGVLANSVRAAVLRLLRHPPGDLLAWEHLQHQKLVRLGRRLAGDPARRRLTIEQAGGAVLIGRRLVQLDRMRQQIDLPLTAADAIGTVLAAMGQRGGVRHAGYLARDAAAAFATSPPLRPTAAALHDLGALLLQYGGFLGARGCPEPPR